MRQLSHSGCSRQQNGLSWWLSGKESACQYWRHKKPGFGPWVGKFPWCRKQQLTPLFLSGEFHGQRSLAGYSPWGLKESDMTEHTHTAKYVMRWQPASALTFPPHTYQILRMRKNLMEFLFQLFHFVNKITKYQRSQVTCLRSHNLR